ncbi:MAG TPA: hypothetical protein VIF57_08920 [Polyangia bacterium]
MRSIDGRESVESFEALRSEKPALAPFEEPAAVAAFLVRKENGLAERDRVLRCLVAEACVGTAKRIALALLILGLWPGLDAIFRKRRRLFQAQAHDLELEIVDQFIAQVQRVNLGRVSCLAATLVLNTEREVVDGRIRECARAAKSDPVTADAIAAPAFDDEGPPPSRFALPFGQSDAQEVAALRRWLQSAVGQDADLVVNAVIHRRSRLALASALGISHAAARQRLARALGRAREAFLVQEQGR